MLGIIFNVSNFQEMVYLTLNAQVDSSTAKNLPSVYPSLKLFGHIVTKGRTFTRGSWFSIPGGGLFVVSATCRFHKMSWNFISTEILWNL